MQVTNSPQSFHWKEYGLKLIIPELSLPENSSSHYIITIKVSLSGQYQFQDDTELVSPIFWLSCKPHCKFLHPLCLEIEHCALPENSKHLSMAMVNWTQEDFPYSFKLLEGGIFSNHSSSGVIALKDFGGIGVIQKWSKQRQYWSDIFYIASSPPNIGWDIHFAITWHDSAHIKVSCCIQANFTNITMCNIPLQSVKNHYASLNAQPGNHGQQLTFKEKSISLEVPKEGHVQNGWKIFPSFSPCVSFN